MDRLLWTVGEAIDGERRLTWLRSALNVLNARELRIVEERRLRDDGATFEALGESLGISKERVRQIENRALEKLRDALLRETPTAPASSERGIYPRPEPVRAPQKR